MGLTAINVLPFTNSCDDSSSKDDRIRPVPVVEGLAACDGDTLVCSIRHHLGNTKQQIHKLSFGYLNGEKTVRRFRQLSSCTKTTFMSHKGSKVWLSQKVVVVIVRGLLCLKNILPVTDSISRCTHDCTE